MRTHGNTKHGLSVKDKAIYSRHPIYMSWMNMRQRVKNPNRPDYKYYGGRGIKIDPKWDKFESFIKDMGMPPEGYTLDRIDNSKNYCKENCKWSSRKEQSNNRDYNAFVSFNGKTQSVGKWAAEINLEITTKNLYKRIFTRHWPIEKAFTQPLKGK